MPCGFNNAVEWQPSAPVSTVLDETYKVAVTRFENRIRVGGMAELAGFDLSLKIQRRKTLEMVVEDLFPGAGALAQGEFWTGLRPMTPDSTPIVGAAAVSSLVREYRPRHARLDDGGRVGPLHRGPDDGPAPGHRPRRARHRSLSGRDAVQVAASPRPHERV